LKQFDLIVITFIKLNLISITRIEIISNSILSQSRFN